jgi:uncharacterized DUF497 family protein
MSKFDWDHGNREKCARRVPVAEIEALIEDPRTLIAGDPYEGETRFRAIGHNSDGRPMFVVFTMRMLAKFSFARSAPAIATGTSHNEEAIP